MFRLNLERERRVCECVCVCVCVCVCDERNVLVAAAHAPLVFHSLDIETESG